MPGSDPPIDSLLIGYAHASLIGALRPDVAYPKRKVRRGTRVVTTITATPCDCPDAHVEVWVHRHGGTTNEVPQRARDRWNTLLALAPKVGLDL